MTTWRSNQTPDQWSAATMARLHATDRWRSRAAAEFDATAPTASASVIRAPLRVVGSSTPEFASPLPIERAATLVHAVQCADLRRRRSRGRRSSRPLRSAGTAGIALRSTRPATRCRTCARGTRRQRGPANPAAPEAAPTPATQTEAGHDDPLGDQPAAGPQVPSAISRRPYSPSSITRHSTSAQSWQNGNQSAVAVQSRQQCQRPRRGIAVTSSIRSRIGATTTTPVGHVITTVTTARAVIGTTTAGRTVKAATATRPDQTRADRNDNDAAARPEGGLHDIGRRLDHLPVGRVHRKIVVAIGLGLFLRGLRDLPVQHDRHRTEDRSTASAAPRCSC